MGTAVRSSCHRSAVVILQLVAIAAFSIGPASAQQPAPAADPVVTLQGIPQDVSRRTPFRRLKYFHDQRAYPFDRIPPGAYPRAREYYDQAFGSRHLEAAPPAFTQNGWTPIGPDHISTSLATSGRINTIAIDPSNTNIIYAGGATGGVWKTTDGGTSWAALTDTQCSLAMGSIAIDPSNASIIYAGTGEENFSLDSFYGCGVLKSTDGGATWTQLGASIFDTTTGGAHIGKIVIHPSVTSTLLVASDFGLYRSTDGGASFALVQSGVATDVVIDPSSPSTMYAAVGNSFGAAVNGVYKSTDTGATWTKLAGGFPTTGVGRISLAIAASSPSTIYATVQNSVTSALLGIFKTADGGINWTLLSATGASCSTQCWYDMVIAVDPTNANTIYFGGLSLFKSTNGGASFSSITDGIHIDQHTLVFLPGNANTVFAGNDGGIFKSTNGGATWTSLNTNIAITQFYPGLSLYPTSASIALGGTQDNHTLLYTGSTVWAPVTFQDVGACDGGFTVIDQITPTTQYAECQSGESISGPRRADTASGGVFALHTTGINLAEPQLFIPPIVGSPSDSQTLYFGTTKVYRTTNRGDMWAAISPAFTGSVSAIAQAPSNANVVYAGTSAGNVRLTTDGGTTWSSIITGLPNRFVTYLAVHPTDPTTAFITFSGFGTGHVFKTTNAGTGWTNISSNLPDVPINAIVLDPSAPTTDIIVGSDLGAFRTSDGGGSWSTFNTGLPNVPVFDLVFNPATNVLAAATHGRGVFKATTLAAGPLAAAVLPSSRAVQVGATATAFATIINAGTATATSCGIALLSSIPASFSYQTTDPATNQVTGTPNTPVNIGAGLFQSYVFALTPTAPIAPTDVQFTFDCTNTNPAGNISGVNTLLFLGSAGPTSDIVALAGTPTNDGIVNIPGTNGTGVFVVATVNVGVSGTLTASADTGGTTLPVVLSLCQTNPVTAACLAPPSTAVTLTINANETPTFGIFVQGTGNVAFNPATNRIFVRFKDAGAVTHGSTSVAVRTQ